MENYYLSSEIDRPDAYEISTNSSFRLINLFLMNGEEMVVYDSFDNILSKLNSSSKFISVDIVYSEPTDEVLDLYTEIINKDEILCTGHVYFTNNDGITKPEGDLFNHKLKARSQIFIGDMAIPVLESYEEIIEQIDTKSNAVITDSSPIKDQSLEITKVSDEGKAGRILLKPDIMHGIADIRVED